MKQKLVTWTILSVTLAQSAAPAWAYGPEDEVCIPAETENQVCEMNYTPAPPVAQDAVEAPSGSFEKLVSDYVHAYQGGNRMRRALYASRIKKSVFESPGSADYISKLELLDRLSATYAEPIYDLARSLQLHWESAYAMGLGQKRVERRNASTKVGAIVGIALLGVAMFKKPTAAPKYFKVLRHLIPLGTTAAGAATGNFLNRSGLLDAEVPASPAHLMKLGISTDEFYYDDSALYRDLTSIMTGIAASSIAYETMMAYRAIKVARAVSLLNKAATFFKVYPLVLIGSLVIGYAVEKGVEYGVTEAEYRRLVGRVQSSRSAMESAQAAGNSAAAFTHADELVKNTVNLAAFLNYSMDELMKEYAEDVAKAMERYSSNERRLQAELKELTDDLADEVRDLQGDRPFTHDSAFEGYLVRGYMLAHDEASIRDLEDSARTRAESLTRTFDRIVSENELMRSQCLDQNVREDLLKQFVADMNTAQDRVLATKLRRGEIRRDVKRILLQVAASIRQTGLEYLQDHAEFLMTMISRNDLLISTAEGRGLGNTADLP